jgi:hypothetical protein
MKLDMNGMRLSPLPRNKSATHVFGDFLSCMRSLVSSDPVSDRSTRSLPLYSKLYKRHTC